MTPTRLAEIKAACGAPSPEEPGKVTRDFVALRVALELIAEVERPQGVVREVKEFVRNVSHQDSAVRVRDHIESILGVSRNPDGTVR